MNAKHNFSRSIPTLSVLAVLSAALGLQPVSLAQEKGSTAKERIGIYDSRAIAVAFAGSPAHQKELNELRAKHKQAKEVGDVATAAKLEAEGQARQAKAHKQGFSTAPVDDILAHLTNAVAEIQRSAGVSAIMSKWDEAELKKHPGAETVDVTMKLVDALQPTERQRQSAIEIQKHKPIPLAQVIRLRTERKQGAANATEPVRRRQNHGVVG